MASSQGALAKMAMDFSGIDENSVTLDFVSESLRASNTLVESEGIRGTRSRTKERVRRGLINVGGDITLHPSPTELDALLYAICGTDGNSSNVFALAETVPSFLIAVDRVAKVHTYSGLKVSRAVFRGSPGTPLELTISVVGQEETEGNAGSFPAVTFDTDTMYVFTDAVFTHNSQTYAIMDFEVVVDNLIEARFTNSTTATDVAATDRRVTCTVTTPYTSSETALYAPASSVAGAAGSLVLTNGGQSLSFAFANMKRSPEETPVVGGRGEITYGQQYNCYKSGSTVELIVTHDSTA